MEGGGGEGRRGGGKARGAPAIFLASTVFSFSGGVALDAGIEKGLRRGRGGGWLWRGRCCVVNCVLFLFVVLALSYRQNLLIVHGHKTTSAKKKC